MIAVAIMSIPLQDPPISGSMKAMRGLLASICVSPSPARKSTLKTAR